MPGIFRKFRDQTVILKLFPATGKSVHCLTVANSLKSNYVSKKDGMERMLFEATHHSNIGILGTIAERGSQGARTALVVMSVLPIVDGAINTDGPHTGRITVAIAIVLLATVTRGPHVNVAQSSSTLRHAKIEIINSIWIQYYISPLLGFYLKIISKIFSRVWDESVRDEIHGYYIVFFFLFYLFIYFFTDNFILEWISLAASWNVTICHKFCVCVCVCDE